MSSYSNKPMGLHIGWNSWNSNYHENDYIWYNASIASDVRQNDCCIEKDFEKKVEH